MGSSGANSCWDMATKGFCPRGGAPNCKFCAADLQAASSSAWQPKAAKGKGTSKGSTVPVQKPQFDKKSTNEKASLVCKNMLSNGSCARGENCKFCKKMIDEWGTNDIDEVVCWGFKRK